MFKQGDRVRVSPSPLASNRATADQPATVLAVRPEAYVVRLDTHAEPFRTLVSAAQVSAL
jgi:hypothetical protein